MLNNLFKLVFVAVVNPVLGIACLAAQAAVSPQPVNTAADLELVSRGGQVSSALRLNTELSGEVNGLVATMTLRQTFRNPSSDWVNGRYVFPLPERAAIDSLTLETDGRIIRGVVKEKQQAKKEFEAAKVAGKKAGLLKQSRPNLFSMSLANIAPDSEVIATVSWVETVEFKSGQFSLRLPTTLTPRFIPGLPVKRTEVAQEEQEFEADKILAVNSASGWALDTDRVPDASEITPWQISQPASPGSHQYSLDLRLNAGLPLATLSSATHALEISTSLSDSLLHRIRFSKGLELLDRDLVINWTPVANQQPDAAIFQQAGSDSKYSLMMVMPPLNNIVQTLPREVIFIIDSSGSMAGVSMPQAQQGLRTALSYLAPSDRFNIVDFDSTARALFSNPVQANARNLGQADLFVSNLNADGGTNMREALELAFSQQGQEGYLQQYVFITDGSVGNEEELFRMIQGRLGEARLFTVGIGSAPNSHFMRGAARYGRGSYEYISSLEQAAERMNALFARINRPVMSDLSINISGSEGAEIYPQKIPDLYLGEPLMVLLKSTEIPGELEINGQLAGRAWQRTLVASTAPQAQNLDKLWARRKIEMLISGQVMNGEPIEKVKSEIVKLGVDHQLVSRYTSFVAIEDKPSRPEGVKAKDKNVPNLMPRGNTMMVPMPNTATPASLLMLVGLGIMLLGLGLSRLDLAKHRTALHVGSKA